MQESAILSEDVIASLIEQLGSEDGAVRRKARRRLVMLRKKSVLPLVNLLQTEDYLLRWEAAKALSQIADPLSASALVRGLEDDESEIRWMSGEGLIRMGDAAVVPILKALIHHFDSAFLRHGSHHVLVNLTDAVMKQRLKPLLYALESETQLEDIPLIAYQLLKELD